MKSSTLTLPLNTSPYAISKSVLLTALLLISLQVLDGVLTHAGLGLGGASDTVREGNELLRYAMNSFGVVPALLLAKTVAVGFIVSLCVLSNVVPWIENALRGLVVVYLALAILPWTGILLVGGL
jgi:hypothetical protein